MINDENGNSYNLNIYDFNTHKNMNYKKIIILVACIIILIILIFITNYSINTISEYRVYKQYESQLAYIKQQENEKQVQKEAEKERIRQAKIPKLTRGR